MHWKRLILTTVLAVAAAACSELEDPPPTAPTVTPSPPSQFTISGRWDGVTDQGRPVRFDISDSALLNGSIALHHDCSGGRLVLPFDAYEAQVNGDSFSVTFNWRQEEGTKYYAGTLTISGRFEGSDLSRGGFINSITDKQQDNLGVCNEVNGTWEATR